MLCIEHQVANDLTASYLNQFEIWFLPKKQIQTSFSVHNSPKGFMMLFPPQNHQKDAIQSPIKNELIILIPKTVQSVVVSLTGSISIL